MKKDINSNAVCELDDESLEQVTGGMKAKQADPIFAIGGGADAMAAPDKAIVQGFQPLPPMLGAEN